MGLVLADDLLARSLQRIQGEIDEAFDHLLPVPDDGRERLVLAMRHATIGGGKRVRPLLLVTTAEMYGASRSAALRAGCAVEAIHAYSLVHDDLPCMDDDALRRGRPTVHVAFSPRVALLAGAALLPAAAALLDAASRELGLGAARRGRLAAELFRAAGAAGMVGGQWLDLEAENAERAVDAAALERIHRLKTGALLGAALRIGALAGGADERVLRALSAYGREVGLAFQIVDDLLDVTRTDAELGKTAGKDEHAGKATYPALFGVGRAREMAVARVRGALAALRDGGIDAPALRALAAYVLERER